MNRTLILGVKYFIRDKVINEVLEVKISQLNDVELSYIDLSLNDREIEETYRDLNDIEIIDIISEEEAKRLNNQDLFSVQTDLIRAIVSRGEIIEFSKDGFKKINKDENTVIISITDPDREPISNNILSQFKDSLSIQFWDVEEGIGRIQPINEEQAKEVREFIIRNKDNNFVIHCEAGMSRSAAVGLSVILVSEHNFDRYAFATSPNAIKEHHRYHPNWFVFDMIVGDK